MIQAENNKKSFFSNGQKNFQKYDQKTGYFTGQMTTNVSQSVTSFFELIRRIADLSLIGRAPEGGIFAWGVSTQFFLLFLLAIFFSCGYSFAAVSEPTKKITVDDAKKKTTDKANKDNTLRKVLLGQLKNHFNTVAPKALKSDDSADAGATKSTVNTILSNKKSAVEKLSEEVQQALKKVEHFNLDTSYPAILDLKAQTEARKTLEGLSQKVKTALTSRPALILGGLLVFGLGAYEIYKTTMMGTGLLSRLGSTGNKFFSEEGDGSINEISKKLRTGAGNLADNIGDEELKVPVGKLSTSLFSNVAQDTVIDEATEGLTKASTELKNAAKEIMDESQIKLPLSSTLPLNDTDFKTELDASKDTDFENVNNVLMKDFKTDDDLQKAATSAKNLTDSLTDEGKLKLKSNLDFIAQEIDGQLAEIKGIKIPENINSFKVSKISENGSEVFETKQNNLQSIIDGIKNNENTSLVLDYDDNGKNTSLLINNNGIVVAKMIKNDDGNMEQVRIEKGSQLLFERQVAKVNDEAAGSLTGDGNKTKREALDDIITPKVVSKALYGDVQVEDSDKLIKNPAKTVEQLGEELQMATSPVTLAQKFGKNDTLAAEEIVRVKKKIQNIDDKYLENKKMLVQQETEIAKKVGVSEGGAEAVSVKTKRWQEYSEEHKQLINKLKGEQSLTDDQFKKKLTKYEADKTFHNKPMQVSDENIFASLSDDQKREIEAVSAVIKKVYPSVAEDSIRINYHPTGGLVVYAEVEKSKCPVGKGKSIFVTLNNASFDVREPGAIVNRFCWSWKPENVLVSSEALLKFGSQESTEAVSKEAFEKFSKNSPFTYFLDDRDYRLGDLSSFNDSWMNDFLKTDHLVSLKTIEDSIDDQKVKSFLKETSPSADNVTAAKDFIAGQLSLEINGFGNRVGKIDGFSTEDGHLRLKTSKEHNIISSAGEDNRKNFFSSNFLKEGATGESLKQQSMKNIIDNAFSSGKVHVKVGDKLIAFNNIENQELRDKVKNIVTNQLNHDLKNTRLGKIRETGSFVVRRTAEPPSKLKVTSTAKGPQAEIITSTQEEREDMSGALSVEYAPAMPQKNLFSALLDDSGAIKNNLKEFVNDLSDLQPQEFLNTSVKNAAKSISSWFKPFSVMSDDLFRASMYEAASEK